MKRKTTEQFILDAKKIHGDRYDYSLVEYINCNNKVKIICKEHGAFEQYPNNHTSNGRGCAVCSKNKKITTNIFITKAKEVHGDRYDYSLVEYTNAHTKVKIICGDHGIFKQRPVKHLRGNRCPNCHGTKIKTTSGFIIDAKKIHGDRYDYSLVEYIGAFKQINILCPIHGIFKQTPDSHINKKCNCPKCSESKGEKQVREYLENNNIEYITQKTFDNCVYKNKLKFDFYLPTYNMCIEYDGIQHFKPIDYFGGEEALIETTKKDNIKSDYCLSNNIQLLRIKYSDNIINKLNKVIKIE